MRGLRGIDVSDQDNDKNENTKDHQVVTCNVFSFFVFGIIYCFFYMLSVSLLFCYIGKTRKRRADGKLPNITLKPGVLSPVPLPKDSILIGNRYTIERLYI